MSIDNGSVALSSDVGEWQRWWDTTVDGNSNPCACVLRLSVSG